MSSESPWPPHDMRLERVDVLDSFVSFVTNEPARVDGALLFVHGNPTSSYLWRHVLAGLCDRYRCVAVDLIGMGSSGKPAISYDYADHARYLEAFVDVLRLRDVVIVGHDWGGVLATDLARRRPDVARALVLCESHLRPWPPFDDVDPSTRAMFEPLRTPGERERLLLDDNMFIEQVLPSGMYHTLTDDEWLHYRRPFTSRESRMPILQWAQQIPIGGQPPDVDAVVRANARFLESGDVRALLLVGDPGAVVMSDTVAAIEAQCPTVEIRLVGAGTHFLPEDCGDRMAAEIRRWL